MKTQITNVVGVQVLCPKLFGDNRGSFMEIWNEHELKQTGISDVFVQDNISTSVKEFAWCSYTDKISSGENCFMSSRENL